MVGKLLVLLLAIAKVKEGRLGMVDPLSLSMSNNSKTYPQYILNSEARETLYLDRLLPRPIRSARVERIQV
jgi:hypothetical protein